MVKTHNFGFPRIGSSRELKFALESYWNGESSADELAAVGSRLRKENWQHQSAVNYVPVGDFSFYDHVLDTSFLLGNIPERVKGLKSNTFDNYFRVARGRSSRRDNSHCIHAGEMTKWFNTNYHYIVPELSASSTFALNAEHLLSQLAEANAQGLTPKPIFIGPVTYLWLSKEKDDSNKIRSLDQLLPVYTELLTLLAAEGTDWVQLDEPILVTELDTEWKQALEKSYHILNHSKINILLGTYFGELQDNVQLACNLPTAGLHIDAIHGKREIINIMDWLPVHKVLSLGVIDGRNIWKTDLNTTLNWLEPIAKKLLERLWLAPSCSLLHVPVDLDNEEKIDAEIKNWLAFAVQKLEELRILSTAINQGREHVAQELSDNAAAILNRQHSSLTNNHIVKESVKLVDGKFGKRQSHYEERTKLQRKRFNLPIFPTTTIGSFPQTRAIRNARLKHNRGELDHEPYEAQMKEEISRAVQYQETLGLDVLVHGEAERNDMVEYFGEQLEGYAFSQQGWVQSYGSRCVKPPILFGDVRRPRAMTVKWTQYAQSISTKPMKGMLTGPVTMLNWSFVRDDQARSKTCLQLALAIRDEVKDLEKAGIGIIQIDEAALREGLPLRTSQWDEYLQWAVECFRLSANDVSDETQIHTHMCYSEFNDIIKAIARMDADVITIETSRSDMELLDIFERYQYPNEIGPGVYDIHSPNIPSEQYIVDLINKAAQRIPKERLWINPDCGLKTRQWEEVLPALKNMIAASRTLRKLHFTEQASELITEK